MCFRQFGYISCQHHAISSELGKVYGLLVCHVYAPPIPLFSSASHILACRAPFHLAHRVPFSSITAATTLLARCPWPLCSMFFITSVCQTLQDQDFHISDFRLQTFRSQVFRSRSEIWVSYFHASDLQVSDFHVSDFQASYFLV